MSTSVKNWNDLEDLFIDLADSVGSDPLLLDSKLTSCLLQLPNPNPNPNPQKSILVLVSSKPLLAPNSNSWAGTMLDRFNINNLTSEIDSKGPFKGYVNSQGA